MTPNEWEEYKRKCKEFDEELDGCANAVMWVSTIIAVVALFAVIYHKVFV